MRGGRWLAPAAVAVAVAVAAAAMAAWGGGGARGSVLSRGGDGWLAARRYLEARGARVDLIAEPLASYEAGLPPAAEGGGDSRERSRPGVLALVLPFQGRWQDDLHAALDAHLARGGDVVIAYGGDLLADEEALDLGSPELPTAAPLLPWRWYRFVHAEWDLRPVMRGGAPARPGAGREEAAGAGAGAGPLPVRVWAQRLRPGVGPGAEALYAGPDGGAAVAVQRRLRGRVVVLPADALANGRLALPGNADLLETLLRNLGRRWAFDEFDHGLVAVPTTPPAVSRGANLLTAHLALLYLLAAAALARREGPAWRESAAPAGSARGFLLDIGALHDRLDHHGEAARLLLQRVRDLDRGLQLPADLERRAAHAGREDLVAIAQEVARLRHGDVR
jgi:hypothetical protein